MLLGKYVLIMKKLGIILIAIIICFTLACNKKITTYTEISYDEYLEKKENKESFPLVIGSTTCSACGIYKGTMENFIEEYQVEVFYIDLSKIEEDDYNKLQAETSFDGTPTTIFINEGNLTSYYNRIDGAGDLTTIKTYFKTNGYIE